MAQSTWQGALRSQVFDKENAVMSKKPTRSALGDISNRSKIITRSKSSASTKGWKKNKTSKPFSIAQTNKKRFLLNPQEPIDEVDKNDLDSPKYAAEYVADIFKYYKEKESTCVASPEYMGIQTDINYKMRALLIDWLCQVHHKFELVPATLYLTVSLLDRFLEKKVVSRRKLQLVGCTCMLIASKYEEIYAPELSDFVTMSDKAFDVDDILRMEGVILNVLKFNLTVPTVYKFLRRYLKVAGASFQIQHHATYIVERTLQEYSMLRYLPSTTAAAALWLSLKAHDSLELWDETMIRVSKYTPETLADCACEIVYLIQKGKSGMLQAVDKKYSSSKYMNVGEIDIDFE